MRLSYYQETDTLYIELNDVYGDGTRTCAQDMVVDVDADQNPIGIEIENASSKTDLSHLKTKGLGSMKIVHDPVIYVSHPSELGHPEIQSMAGHFKINLQNSDLIGGGPAAGMIMDILGRQTGEVPQENIR